MSAQVLLPANQLLQHGRAHLLARGARPCSRARSSPRHPARCEPASTSLSRIGRAIDPCGIQQPQRPQSNRRVGMIQQVAAPSRHPSPRSGSPSRAPRARAVRAVARKPPQLRQPATDLRVRRAVAAPVRGTTFCCRRAARRVPGCSAAARLKGATGRVVLGPQPPDPSARLVPGVARVGVIHPDVAPVGDVNRTVRPDRGIDRTKAPVGRRHERIGIDGPERRAVRHEPRGLHPAGQRHARDELPLVTGQLPSS